MEELIDPKLIVDMLRRATADVLTTMLDLDAHQRESYMEHQPPGKSEGVVSFVGLAGKELAGTGSLQCSSAAACRLAARFLMAEFASVDDDVLDAFGELTNMIIGNFKNDLEHHTGPMGLSIPTVIHGHNFSTRSPGHENWMVVPFQCCEDILHVKICLKARESVETPVRYGDKQEFILN